MQQHAGGAVTSPLSAPLDSHGAATPRIRRATGAILEPSLSLATSQPSLPPRVSRTVLYPYRTHVPYLLLTCSSSVRIFSALRSRTVQVSAFGSPKPTSSASGWLHLQYLREGGTPAGRMGGRVVVVVVVVVAIFGVCTECCMLYVPSSTILQCCVQYCVPRKYSSSSLYSL